MRVRESQASASKEARKLPLPPVRGVESSSSTTDGMSKQTLVSALLFRGQLYNRFSEALCGLSANELAYAAEMEKRKGNECLKAGEIEDAFIHFHQAIESCRIGDNECFSASVQYNLATCFIRWGFYNDAEYHCSLAPDANPSGVRTSKLLCKKCRSRLGKLAYIQGRRFGDAVSHFEMALELAPSNAQLLKLMSRSNAMGNKKFNDGYDSEKDDFIYETFFNDNEFNDEVDDELVDTEEQNCYQSKVATRHPRGTKCRGNNN
jgi:tetratricopeptide (TPR) repeat protein